jgi:hypothetical protein
MHRFFLLDFFNLLHLMILEFLEVLTLKLFVFELKMKRSRDKMTKGRVYEEKECKFFLNLEVKATPMFLRGLCPILGLRT